jgi:signal transduction histidine kinase
LVSVAFQYKPIVFPRFPSEIEAVLFRIVQESLTNILRHAESKDARIYITQENESVRLRVRDFGKGISENKLEKLAMAGVGISGMKERVNQLNGKLRVSRAEPGILVEAVIPLTDSLPVSE